MTTIKECKDLAKQYNALKTDKERLAFLKEQKGNMQVTLDNDLTMVEFILMEVMEPEAEAIVREIDLNAFDNYHGWGDGVIELFRFAGIDAESC